MRRPVAAALSSFLVAASTATAQEPKAAVPAESKCLAITFDQVSVLEVDRDGEGPNPATQEQRETKWTATLGQHRFAVQSGDSLETWDFTAGVVRGIDRAAGTYTEVAMLHEVAFVQNEMRNRLGLKGALQSASLPIADEWMPFDLSVLFVWAAEGDDTKLQHVEKDGWVASLRDGDTVARWTFGDQELDAAQRALFGRLLQRRARLHPQALTALLAGGRLPEEMVSHWRDVGVRGKTTWRLAEVRADAAWPGGIDGASRSFGTGPLARIAGMVLEPTAAGVPERLTFARFGELADAAQAAGRHGDALLLLLEGSLTTGEPMPQMTKLAADPAAQEQVKRFMQPISLAERAPDRALSLFAAIDRTELSRPAILDVFRVTAMMGKRDPVQARELMLATLEASPWITMAYKDLGDIFLVEFDTRQAWIAWELGRRIAPGHACWEPVAAYEQQLRRTFADRL